jgi:ABC-2 type transport system permease protein
MIVMSEQLYRSRRAVLGWAIGAGLLAALTAGVYPSIQGQEGFEEMVAELSPAMKAIFGLDTSVSILSPAGYLQGRMFASLLPLLLVIMAVIAGSRWLAGSERTGTLELTVAAALPRRSIAWQLWAASVLVVTVAAFTSLLVLLAMAGPTAVTDGIGVGRLVAMHLAVAVLAIVHGAVAFGLGAATGNPTVGSLVAASLAVGGYVLSGLVEVADGLRPIVVVLPWHWYTSAASVAGGVRASAFLPALAVTAVVVAAGIWVFERRDLRTA